MLGARHAAERMQRCWAVPAAFSIEHLRASFEVRPSLFRLLLARSPPAGCQPCWHSHIDQLHSGSIEMATVHQALWARLSYFIAEKGEMLRSTCTGVAMLLTQLTMCASKALTEAPRAVLTTGAAARVPGERGL